MNVSTSITNWVISIYAHLTRILTLTFIFVVNFLAVALSQAFIVIGLLVESTYWTIILITVAFELALTFMKNIYLIGIQIALINIIDVI